jgi:hypothetical protein
MAEVKQNRLDRELDTRSDWARPDKWHPIYAGLWQLVHAESKTPPGNGRPARRAFI